MSRNIPQSWEAKPLSDLAEYHNGRAFKPQDWTTHGLPIIRIAQINNPEAEYDYYAGQDVDAHHLIGDGDILFSWSATLTAIKWSRGPGVLNQHIFKVVPKPDIDRDYLLYTILNSIDALAEHSHGSTMKHIKKGVLKLHKVSVPPLPEQRRIAEILSSVDEAIQATQLVIEQTRKVQQGILKSLLTKGIGHTRFKQTEIGEIPAEWQCLQVMQVMTKMDSGWSPDCDLGPAGEEEWGVLKTSAVVWGGYRAEENKRLPKGLQPRPEIEVKTGDVLITRAGPVDRTGVVAFVDQTPRKLMLSDKIIRIQSKLGVCLPEFLSLTLSSPAVQAELIKRKSGMAMSQTNISQKTLRDTFIPLPPIDEQRQIVEALRSISEAARVAENEFASLQATKSVLMSELLTGRKRVISDLPLAAE